MYRYVLLNVYVDGIILDQKASSVRRQKLVIKDMCSFASCFKFHRHACILNRKEKTYERVACKLQNLHAD